MAVSARYNRNMPARVATQELDVAGDLKVVGTADATTLKINGVSLGSPVTAGTVAASSEAYSCWM